MRSLPALLALAALCVLPGCSERDAPREHGLAVEEPASKPTGDAVKVAYAFEDGETWVAHLVLHAQKTQARTDRTDEQVASAKSTFRLKQTFEGGTKPRSRTWLKYTRIQDATGTDVKVPTGVTLGSFPYGADGRPDPSSLVITGDLIAESQTLYRSLLLAGFGGTESWVPARAVQEGETWRAAETVDPQMLKTISMLGLRPDVSLPPAKLSGSFKLEKIERTEQGTFLHIRANLLIEIRGETLSDNKRGRMSTGYQVEGFAKIDQRTGLPVELDTRAVMDNNETMAGQSFKQRLELGLRGTIRREGE
jgi:hypothetical protein